MKPTQAENFENSADAKIEFKILFLDGSQSEARARSVTDLFNCHGADSSGRGNRLRGGYFQILEVRKIWIVEFNTRVWSASTETLERVWR